MSSLLETLPSCDFAGPVPVLVPGHVEPGGDAGGPGRLWVLRHQRYHRSGNRQNRREFGVSSLVDLSSSASTELRWTTGLTAPIENSTDQKLDLDRTLMVPKTRSMLKQELVSHQDLDLFKCESSKPLPWSWYQNETGSGYPNFCHLV